MVLPALNGTMARIGLAAGQACAAAKWGSAGAAKPAAVNVKKRRRFVVVIKSSQNYIARVFF
jgi:hypothetical protein